MAGSEKATSDKERTKEGKYINTRCAVFHPSYGNQTYVLFSLLTLGTVIGTLADNASKRKRFAVYGLYTSTFADLVPHLVTTYPTGTQSSPDYYNRLWQETHASVLFVRSILTRAPFPRALAHFFLPNGSRLSRFVRIPRH